MPHVLLPKYGVYSLHPPWGVVLSCIERNHLWLVYANWLRRLAEYDSVADFSALGLDDLHGRMPHWVNAVHFSEQTGDEILRSLGSDDYPRIEKTTISANSEALRDRVLEWIGVNGTVAPHDKCPR